MEYKPLLPKKWNADLAYFFGLLLGDGSLPNATSIKPNGKLQQRYSIYFISNSKEFLDEIYVPLFFKLFSIKPYLMRVKFKKSPVYNCRLHAKQIYQYLVRIGYISGRKARIASIPSSLPQKYYKDILAGLLDTDGGKKGSGFGLSTSSNKLADFCILMFKKYNIPYRSCPWEFNNHIYHQIYVHKREMWKILKTIPIKNKDKIDFLMSYTPR